MARRIYVAGRFGAAATAEALAKFLRLNGHKTVSNWHAAPPPAEWENDLAQRAGVCAANVAELRAADTLVVLAHADCRGTLIELGLAWSLGHRVVVLGERTDLTLMADLPGVVWVADPAAALAVLR